MLEVDPHVIEPPDVVPVAMPQVEITWLSLAAWCRQLVSVAVPRYASPLTVSTKQVICA